MDALIFVVGLLVTVAVVAGMVVTIVEFRRIELTGGSKSKRFPL